ncbi:ferrous iron transport protein B [Lachnoclostridium sp. Marseille-P6806]|uniref:ferrous iron transport protein B n=1 Tax=Lachnoclostridium sp. Marseille-P6806 TaxID=2364793 RepID=UPI001031BF92|nr:ferrous iron transport protein B [Lachnoclostridium sp. Marseille-P6806]
MTLRDLKAGESARIDTVGGEGALRQHFLDMGLIPGAEATVVKFAPLGDPMELRIHGYELTLRLDDADRIEITGLDKSREGASASGAELPAGSGTGAGGHTRAGAENAGRGRRPRAPHPALGESYAAGGKGKERTPAFPEDHIYSFALVGNQNSGKTTLFNRLTGANQHVGNFPGVTVDRKDGVIIGQKNTLITDLPGIYSMSPYSSEELVSRNFVLDEKPDAIINIVDATNIERNLYLTMQLLEMERPVVIALNMMDELTGNHGSVDINRMEKMLGAPVVPISAAKNQGVDELIKHAVNVAKYQIKPEKQDFCSEEDHGGALHRCIHSVSYLIEDHAKRADLPLRFAACKVIEGDQRILAKLAFEENEAAMLENVTAQMEAERGLDRSAAIADMRFDYIGKVCDACVTKPAESREHARSGKIDRILTGKYTAIPIFVLVMALVFYLTFNVIGLWLQDLFDLGIHALADLTDHAMTAAGISRVLHDLIINGIFEGVGSVLSFLPIVVTMFFFLSLLEDSGYIARVAFFMDKLLRRIGLSGRSIVPMLIGFGCTVPAVMSTRTLPSERDRRMTILLTPFMSCTAKLPIYAFFVSAFFPGRGGLIMTGLYLLGIITGILIAFLYKKTLFQGEAVPFVMELPNYRLPSPRSTVQLMWEKAKDFLHKAFSVILIATIVVWFLQSFDIRFHLVQNSADSMMAMIAGVIAPVFAPLGLGDWRVCTALISGFMAKESVVSTLEVLFDAEGGVAAVLSPAAAGAMLIFSLLYTPCVAAIASIRRELGGKWAAGVVLWQCVIAWIAAFVFHAAAGLL